MNLEKSNLVELNAHELRSVDGGGGLISVLKKIYQVAKDAAIWEATCYVAKNPLTPGQAADYFKYRRM